MKHHRSIKLHYYVRGGILLSLTTYIVYLVHVDKLHYYIVPRMAPYMKLTVIALYLLALYCIYLAWQEKDKAEHTHNHDQACSCQHEVPRSKMKSTLLYSIFIVPLLLGFAMPDQIMGSDIAAVKGMNLSASNSTIDSIVEANAESGGSQTEQTEEDAAKGFEASTPVENSSINDDLDSVNYEQGEIYDKVDASATASNEQTFEALFPSDQYSVELAELGKLLYIKDVIAVKEEGFLETLTTLDLYRNNFIGKTIKMSGFVYREDGMSQDTFVVSRMAMQCCSADAAPYGFLVQWDAANTLEKDKWVEVVGTFGLTQYNDIEIVQLKATSITEMEAPNDPYVYPYFDDFVNIALQ